MTSSLPATTTNQSRSSVGRDQVGTQNIFNNTSSPAGRIDHLLAKLQSEMENDEQIRDTIDKLQRFRKVRVYDGVIGLEAKLRAGNRDHECYDAFEKKELFSKLLERFSLYASAQEIIAYLLARAEYKFTHLVYPEIDTMTVVQINRLVDAEIIQPTIDECGSSVLFMDHSEAMGMIYWLAEQCHIR